MALKEIGCNLEECEYSYSRLERGLGLSPFISADQDYSSQGSDTETIFLPLSHYDKVVAGRQRGA